MEYRILGPLEVVEEGRQVDIGGPRQRALLAVLLLNANEVVSRDHLIDELWGDEPPATAIKTLQAYVSRLRHALNRPGALETVGHGYRLLASAEEIDAVRFQRRVELAIGHEDPAQAAADLRDALALWRGPVLVDLAHDGFARAEIARLEELRMTALERRIDADLELGRHPTLVAELEALVAQYPLREQLRGQLMLALYRAGRQTSALRVYQEGRRGLAEELGLEPSPELRRLEREILEHDPALSPPPRRRGLPSRRVRLRGPVVVLAMTAALAVAAFPVLDDSDSQPAAERDLVLAGPRAGVLDPSTGRLLATTGLGTTPSSIAVGDGRAWVIDADDKTISRIDATGRTRAKTFSTASTPTDIAVGAGAIWVGNAARGGHLAGTSFPRSVSRLDPDSGEIVTTIALPAPREGQYFQGGGFNQQHIAATRAAVWVINPDRTISRIDPSVDRRVATIKGVRAWDIAADEQAVWVLGAGRVIEIDPATNGVRRRIDLAAESMTAIALGAGAVWIADALGGSVWRIDPRGRDHVLRQIPLALGVRSIAFGDGALWATNEVADEVYRIDPLTNAAKVVSRVVAPQRVAAGGGKVWVTSLGPPAADEALPDSVCRRVSGGVASPQLQIVSDLPLRGSARRYTVPMEAAIRFVLERRGYRAGRFSVGYQSCDVSTAQSGGTDIFRCFSNAKAYARRLDVVGVIGSYHSFCSAVLIPVANRAPQGPLALISPSNTVSALTRSEPGARPAEQPERLYPSGERNFVRIAAADHLSAAALVKLAQDLGHTRIFVAWDREDPYMAGLANDMRRAITAGGLQLAGAEGWNPEARSFAGLARRVASARPGAVLLSGAAPPHTGALIGDLRRALGREPAVIASDGFGHFDALIAAAGRSARGMYVGSYGVPDRELPPAGQRFLEAFETTAPRAPDFTASYAAQAAELLLDAIARSDGTRPSVNQELRRSHIDDGILGDIRFDRNGDLVDAPVTIFRVGARKARVDRVITVRAS